MQTQLTIISLIFVATMLVVTGACRDHATHSHNELAAKPAGLITPKTIVKAYHFPKEHRDTVNDLVESLQWAHGSTHSEQVHTISPRPRFISDDQVAINAPQYIHDTLPELFARLSDIPPPSASLVSLSMWLVVAHQKAQAELPGSLRPIKESLQVIGKDRNMSFSLLEKLRINGLSGQESQIEGSHAKLQVVPTKKKESIHLSLQIETDLRKKSETTISVRPGQQLVVGQVGYEVGPKEEVELYYIVVAK